MTARHTYALMLVQLISTAPNGISLVLHSVWTLLIWANLSKHYKGRKLRPLNIDHQKLLLNFPNYVLNCPNYIVGTVTLTHFSVMYGISNHWTGKWTGRVEWTTEMHCFFGASYVRSFGWVQKSHAGY